MFEASELFWNASLDALKKGYTISEQEKTFICLFCGSNFEKGQIFKDGELFFEAEKACANHVEKAHGPVFNLLLGMNKKYTGLTDLQKKVLTLFYRGLSDQETVSELGGSSASTIRNHRFSLRERQKQAKIFLAIMELTEEKMRPKSKFVTIHRTANMVDERFAVTQEENEKFIATYFKEGADGPLSEFPGKEKRKIVVLRHLAKRFQPGRRYTERETNAILSAAYHDYVTLRRYMIEYGFLDRTNDCKEYWIKE